MADSVFPSMSAGARDNPSSLVENEDMDPDAEADERASRTTAYLSYAEKFKARLELCRQASVQVRLTVGANEHETAEFFAGARRLWNEHVDGFESAEELLRSLGPAVVVEFADDASAELAAYRATVDQAIRADADSPEARAQSVKLAYRQVCYAYVLFLHVAAEAAGDDDVLRLGHYRPGTG